MIDRQVAVRLLVLLSGGDSKRIVLLRLVLPTNERMQGLPRLGLRGVNPLIHREIQ